MKILLVNNNQVVQKLIDVTTKKVDCELTTLISFREFERENDVKKYDLVVFDQEILEEYKGDLSFLSGLKSIILYSQAMQDSALLSHFTYTIKKPFLPNEFLSFLVSTKQSLKEKQQEEFANLNEKEMFANIDAEDDGGENDDDLNQLLKDLNIPTDDSASLAPKEDNDDLEALLQELPEEDHLENEQEEKIYKGEEEKQDELEERKIEEEVGLEDVEDLQEQDEELEELDKITEDNIDPLEDISQETKLTQQSEEIEQKNEDNEVSSILEDDEIDTLENEEHQMGGALDFAEIVKVQNLLNEVQKSGGKIGQQASDLDLLQNLLSSRSPEGIREILDGMQLTINISFPKKDHK